ETAEMTVLDLVAGQVKKRVPVGQEPEGVTLRPDGKFVYVTSEQDSVVVPIDTRTLAAGAKIATGYRPRTIVFARDGRTAVVACENAAAVTIVDVAKGTAAGTIKIEPKAKTVLGPRPMGAVLSPDGKRVFVSNGRGESVSIIDVAARKAVGIIDGVGARPWGI